jgi:hypothetical protein
MTVSAPVLHRSFLRISIIGFMGSTYSDLKDQLLAVVGGLKSVENGRELLTLELDCARALAGVSPIALRWWRRRGERSGGHTVDDGTNDLVDLAIVLAGLGAGEALDGGGERPDGLGSRAERRSAKGPGNTAVGGKVISIGVNCISGGWRRTS